MVVAMSEFVFVEYLTGSLAFAHDHLPSDVDPSRIVEMSPAQADLLGVRECPTCRNRVSG